MRRVLPILALLILIVGAVAGAYLAWDWWRKSKDSDNDGIADYIEGSEYHTNPFEADTDDDGLNDKFEIDNNLDPSTPNPTYVYLNERNALEPRHY